MRLTTKDTVGVGLLVATFAALLLHNAPTNRHRESHVSPIVDAGGAITSAVEVQTFAFHDVNVLPMLGDAVLRHQVVLVQNGFVTRMGAVGVIEPPAGALIIEGHGRRYLAPGLTDAHAHLGSNPEELLGLFLANGVTTVFNLDGSDIHLALRQRIRDGDLLGPTIYTAGPFVDEDVVRSPADARRVVRQQHARGFDFVKLHGHVSRESFEALTATGREEGIAVIGHAPRNLPLSAVLENAQIGITHAEDLIYTEFMSLDSARLGAVARDMAAAGTWLTPGLVNFENIAAQWAQPEGLQEALQRRGARLLPPALRRDWSQARDYVTRDPRTRPRIEQMLAFHGPLIRSFHAAGVPMLAGTDAGLAGMVPGFSLHDEVIALNRVGLSPHEALATATANPGVFVRENVDASAQFGTIEPSARADLILLEGDPRESLESLREPVGVMVRGRWLDRPRLDRLVGRYVSDR